MESCLEVHNNIKSQAKKLAHADVRDIAKMKIGEAIRQGDVYVEKVDESVISKDYTKACNTLQLAKGTTKGSRHILVSTPSLKVFDKVSPSPLEGPGFTSKTAVTITHPEHAHFKLPAGSYVVTYQQDFAAEEIRAVRD